MATEQPETDDWDNVSFVISSKYRKIVIRRLGDQEATPSTIAEEDDISISNVSQALQELREKNLVELLVPEERKKGRLYGMTEKGAEISERVEQVA